MRLVASWSLKPCHDDMVHQKFTYHCFGGTNNKACKATNLKGRIIIFNTILEVYLVVDNVLILTGNKHFCWHIATSKHNCPIYICVGKGFWPSDFEILSSLVLWTPQLEIVSLQKHQYVSQLCFSGAKILRLCCSFPIHCFAGCLFLESGTRRYHACSWRNAFIHIDYSFRDSGIPHPFNDQGRLELNRSRKCFTHQVLRTFKRGYEWHVALITFWATLSIIYCKLRCQRHGATPCWQCSCSL